MNGRSYRGGARTFSHQLSVICQSVRALESDLGCSSLNRLGKRVVLTACRCSFFCIMLKIVLKVMPKPANPSKGFKKGSLPRQRMGTGAAPFKHLLATILTLLRGQHQNLLLTARVERPSQIVTSLNSGELEIALVEPPTTLLKSSSRLCSMPDWRLSFRPLIAESGEGAHQPGSWLRNRVCCRTSPIRRGSSWSGIWRPLTCS